MAGPIQLSRITAIMLGVRDIAPALEFYKDKLGLTVIMQEPSLALLQCGCRLVSAAATACAAWSARSTFDIVSTGRPI